MSKLSSKDIAMALGLSSSTVSRVLNDKGRISKKTRDMVFQYIKENDSQSIYLKENKKRQIVGVVVAKLTNEFFANIVEQLQLSLSSKNILLVIMYSNYTFEYERQSFLSLVENEVDCIVALATRHDTITREELKGIPLITIDDCNPLIDDVPNCRIISDQYVGGVLATEELIQKGCKKIAFFTNIGKHQIDYKLKGYRDVLSQYDIPYDENLFITSGMYSENSIEDARMMVEYLLAKKIEFDGVFATSDRRALGVINALNEYNITCPDQIKVVGYDASTLAESFNITSISQDSSLIAKNCYLNILKLLGLEDHHQVIKSPIPVFLVKGKTT